MFFLPLISAVLSGLAFQRESLGFLVFIGLIPFLYALEEGRVGFLKGWLAGFVFFGITINWLMATEPSAWAGISGWEAEAAKIFIWLGAAVVLGLSWGLFFWLFYFIKTGKWGDFLTIPSAWILGEYFRAWFFSVFFWGEGAILGPYWTFGHLGYAVSALFSAGRLVGLYGLGFVVVLINLVLLRLIKRTVGLKTVSVIVVFIFLITVAGYFFTWFFSDSGEPLKGVKVAALQLQSRTSASLERLQQIIRQKKEQGFLPVDIFVAPENSLLFPNFKEKEMFQKILAEDGMAISAGYRFNEYGERFGAIVYQDAEGRVISRQEKNFLIPAGEFLPKNIELFFRIINPSLIERFNQFRKVKWGEEQEQAVVYNNLKIAGLSCSAIVAPEFYRRLAKQGAEILVNSASHEIIQNSAAFYRQMKAMAVWNAVANARPFIQSNVGGFSYIIDKNGRVVGESNEIKDDLITGEIVQGKRRTLYSLLGEWAIFAAFFIIIIVLAKKYWFNIKKAVK